MSISEVIDESNLAFKFFLREAVIILKGIFGLEGLGKVKINFSIKIQGERRIIRAR